MTRNSMWLVLSVIILALAGCGQDDSGSDGSDAPKRPGIIPVPYEFTESLTKIAQAHYREAYAARTVDKVTILADKGWVSQYSDLDPYGVPRDFTVLDAPKCETWQLGRDSRIWTLLVPEGC